MVPDLAVFYVLIPSQVAGLPCSIGLVWKQEAQVPADSLELGLEST
jgi:hypothetical protein